MPRAIVTARIPQEQFAQIEQLVSDGIFVSRSQVLQTFIDLGLEYCTSIDGNTQELSAEFKAKAVAAIQNVAVCNMAEFIIEELSCLIEMKYKRSIIDSLARIKELATQVSPNAYQWLMEILEAESIYQVAQRIAGENNAQGYIASGG